EDKGRFLRRLIADFEVDYDVAEYSLERHLDWIRSPIQLHQGSADDAVPQRWSDEFVTALEELDKDVQYFVYERDDHNFARGSWETVVNRNIKFYKERLQ
ncbi:MAG: alpha/beta hydrolase family protein, partial [Candidatus Paceibacterota bacterium]